MRNCVNKNGKIYSSNGIFDKDTLYSTQGEQVYQSSLRCDLSVQMRGSLNCKSYLLNTDEELVMKLQTIPRFQIGASTEEDGAPKMKTENVLSFICGVDSKVEAVKATKAMNQVTENLRNLINSNKDCLPTHPKSGEVLPLSDIRILKEKVSSHNQKVRQTLEGKLLEAKLTKGTAEWSINYGEGMARNRIQVARYSMRIKLTIRHNLFEEFSEANFKEAPETCDYYISKNKRYSEPRTYVIDLPITSVKQYQQCRKVLSKFIESFEHEQENIFKQNDSEVIYLTTSEERTDEQIANDTQIARKFELNLEVATDEDSEEDLIAQSILNSLLDSSSNEEIDTKKPSNKRSRKYSNDGGNPGSKQQ